MGKVDIGTISVQDLVKLVEYMESDLETFKIGQSLVLVAVGEGVPLMTEVIEQLFEEGELE